MGKNTRRSSQPSHLAFKSRLDFVLNKLTLPLTGKPKDISGLIETINRELGLMRLEVQGKKSDINHMAERDIFNSIYTVFRLRHEFNGRGKNEGSKVHIGAMAAMGAGKTTVTRALEATLRDMGHSVIFKEEKHPDNPFWQKSQKDARYMLRSQSYFLLANIRAHYGRDDTTGSKAAFTISDTSVLTDVLMWATWYWHMGTFSGREYESYLRLVEFCKPIIPRPGLLLVLGPKSSRRADLSDYVERLRQGVNRRLKSESHRRQERLFTREETSLARQVKIVLAMEREINQKWAVPTLKLTVDPLDIFDSPASRREVVDKIMGNLGKLLKRQRR